jgi:hypothetical protein
MSEKNVIIHNLQENFNRERNAMLYEISTLKWQLAAEKERVKIAAQKQETGNGEEGEEECRDGGAATTKPEVGPEPVGEWSWWPRGLQDSGASSQAEAQLGLHHKHQRRLTHYSTVRLRCHSLHHLVW